MHIRGFLILIFLSSLISAKSQILDTSIEIRNHFLYFHIIKGSGIPIVFESGAGNDGSVWKNILNPIYKLTGATLITYDRAGFGKSSIDTFDAVPDHHGLTQGVKDLDDCLKRLDYPNGIMIVAHSYGAFYASLISVLHPNFVKSVVFIDGNLSCFFTKGYIENMTTMYAKEIEIAKSQDPGSYYLYTSFSEAVEVISKTRITDSISIFDIVSEKTPFADSINANRWKLCHSLFALSRKNYKGFTACGTGHYIFNDNPQMVIDAISLQYLKLLASAKSKWQVDELQKALEKANN